MQLRMLKDRGWQYTRHLLAGQVYTMPDPQGQMLIDEGSAERCEAEMATAEPVTERAVSPPHKRRGRPRKNATGA